MRYTWCKNLLFALKVGKNVKEWKDRDPARLRKECTEATKTGKERKMQGANGGRRQKGKGTEGFYEVNK